MEKLKVTLDTNILISGIFWRGNSSKILEACRNGQIQLVVSTAILSEFKEILEREIKFKQTQEEIQTQIEALISFSSLVIPKHRVDTIKNDVEDNAILECAEAGKADYIVSGDKHLIQLKEYRGIKIVTAQKMVKILSL